MDNIRFEKVTKFKNVDFKMPCRKTAGSAGYDFVVAEDTIIPPYSELMTSFDIELFNRYGTEFPVENTNFTLEKVAEISKATKAKPTLVSTGVKAHMPENMYLELSVRSSCPLKYWLVMANGVGIIDSDYADNPDNEGEIFFQLINFSPVPILLKKGDVIGQGIFKTYWRVKDDFCSEVRIGGFGSTNG